MAEELLSAAAQRLAAIDVGTNSVLLTVAVLEGGRLRPLAERAELTRLGRGVDETKRLAEEGQKATLRVLGAFCEEALSFGIEPAQISCVATSAARDAENGDAFLDRVRGQLGLLPEIIGGGREAALTFLAARQEFGQTVGRLGICDIGGGSTELAFDLDRAGAFARSLEIGAVRLHERHGFDRAAIEADVQAALSGGLPKAEAPFAGTLVGVAGTWTTLATLALELPHYIAERVHGSQLSAAAVASWTDRLWRLSLSERLLLPGMQPGRADVIQVGASIAAQVLRAQGIAQVTISDRGVRWGLLYERTLQSQRA